MPNFNFRGLEFGQNRPFSLQMIVKAGYPIHFDHKVLQRKLRVFQSHPDLLDWINEVITR